MKIKNFTVALLLISLTACSSATLPRDRHHSPETMLITYHVRPGKESELQDVISRAWGIYRQNKMAFAQPHTIVQDKEDGDKTRIIEIFTWVSASVPDHAPMQSRKPGGRCNRSASRAMDAAASNLTRLTCSFRKSNQTAPQWRKKELDDIHFVVQSKHRNCAKY